MPKEKGVNINLVLTEADIEKLLKRKKLIIASGKIGNNELTITIQRAKKTVMSK